jgi:glycosyltransferase involved in cell wall biosynthesis
MKIGIDVRPMLGSPAGIGYYVRCLLEELKNINGDDHFILYADKNFDFHDDNNRFRKVVIPKFFFFWHFIVYLDALLFSKVDLYFSTHSSIICQFPILKTALTIHDLSSIRFAETHRVKERIFLGKMLLNRSIRKTKIIISPSEFTKSEIVEIFHVPEEKIKVIPEGVVNFSRNTNKDRIYSFPYILFLGTLEPRKNLGRLVQAFGDLIKQRKINHKLIIVGRKGWFYENIFSEVERLNLKGKIIFTGYLEETDAANVLENCDLFIFPSLYEGFGLPPLQAAMNKVLVVSSNMTSLPEILGNNAIYIDPLSIESIKEGILRATALNKEQRKAIIESGYLNAIQYTWEKAARMTLNVFYSITKS